MGPRKSRGRAPLGRQLLGAPRGVRARGRLESGFQSPMRHGALGEAAPFRARDSPRPPLRLHVVPPMESLVLAERVPLRLEFRLAAARGPAALSRVSRDSR